MAKFKFSIAPLFPERIVRIQSKLYPDEYVGDTADGVKKYSEIIDRMGQWSAAGLHLNNPVTSARRLKSAINQSLYLIGDTKIAPNGLVFGFLKVGTKNLYLYDDRGQSRNVEEAPCILDFYVHEAHRRRGIGKELYDEMLRVEKWSPISITVDRPSEKMLSFMKKHFGLIETIPQLNHFALYKGFFDLENFPVCQSDQKPGKKSTKTENKSIPFISTKIITGGKKLVSPKKTLTGIFTSDDTLPMGNGEMSQRFAARPKSCKVAELFNYDEQGAESMLEMEE